MKVLATLTFLASAILCILSCDKDPEPPLLVGKWQMTGGKVDLQVDGKSLKAYLISTGKSAAVAQDIVDDLSSQNDVSSLDGTMEFKSDGTWSGDNDGIDATTGTWKLSDDKKTLSLTYGSDPSHPENASVTKLTDSELQIEVHIGSDDDLGFPIDHILSLNLKKI